MNKILKLTSYIVLITFLFTQIAFADTIYFYHTDPAGTPIAMTDASGSVVWKADYKPFGEEWSITSNIENNKRFVGKEKDTETGLNYFGARYMSSNIGRFISTDPVGPVNPATGEIKQIILHDPQRLNLYSYGLNNPYKYVDDNGREVRISGHIAASPFGLLTNPHSYHLSIILIPDKPNDFTDKTGWTKTSDDKISSTLGGQCCANSSLLNPLGNLQSMPNYLDDRLSNGTFSQVVETPAGMTDTQFINSLIKAAGSYDNSLNYDALPSIDGGYNSNSYVSGVLKAAGATPPKLNTGGKFKTPGYEKPIPLKLVQ